ncbi:DUF2065 domain-containing protein [Thiomicrospira sp. ALE5]|uniref:DUF2065 domain-containing protein n=1 Tax=Thiomicrospira sp. ALE5 TaxID=748650 RepID=UPI0008F23C3D|nr:DUF2065 domain-containing protein [Thiomicrospira sp. ALE5]SFR59035.1 hypothetical protein SAMN03092900_1432 [Thiomicrospira sp. ALE5]
MLATALITAFALVLIIEGLLPLLFPKLWRRMVLSAANLPLNHLRMTGLALVLIGLAMLMLWG